MKTNPHAPTLVSVEEYLSTDYSPDCDYVEGVILERNVGEKSHNELQKALLLHFGARERELGVFAIQEQRLKVTSARYRIPDLCIVVGREPDEEIFTKPPLLCIEILSPEDRMSRMQEKIDDYLAFDVHYVWVIDPKTRSAWAHTPHGIAEAKDGVLRTQKQDNAPEIVVRLAELFDR